jgi:hypothetical protein
MVSFFFIIYYKVLLMNFLRIYKTFYCIDIINKIENYNLIDVYEVFVEIINLNNEQIVESLIVQKDSLGLYYIDINHFLYDPNLIYQIVWNVKYIENSPLKKIKNNFKLYNSIIGQNIDIKLLDSDISIFVDKQEVKLFNDDEIKVSVNNKKDIKIKEDFNEIKLKI